MDRQLVVEFPWLLIKAGGPPPAPVWENRADTDTRQLAGYTTAYVQETKLDLSGYTQSDLTVGFRRSFEQSGGIDYITWQTFDVQDDGIIENVIISSVPMNDAQLGLTFVSCPGFTPYNEPALALDWGNFNRTHIIHGHFRYLFPNSTIGSTAFGAKGAAALMAITDNDYSSLEPTAADCLYCYRIIAVPNPGTAAAGIETVSLPPKRVILDAFTVKEPDLEYMMRLKRSYELANQV